MSFTMRRISFILVLMALSAAVIGTQMEPEPRTSLLQVLQAKQVETRIDCSASSFRSVTVDRGQTVPLTVADVRDNQCGFKIRLASRREFLTIRCTKVDLPDYFVIRASNKREYITRTEPFQYTFENTRVNFDVYARINGDLTGSFECEAISSSSPPPDSITTTVSPIDNTGCQCGVPNEDKIVGGQDADEGEYPWQVSLRYYGSHYCGGTLVTATRIITAAHCDVRVGEIAVLGEYYRNVTEAYTILRTVREVFNHGDYSSSTNDNDIAVVRIDAVEFSSKISPICLPVGSDTYAGSPLTTSGWGTTSEGGELAVILQEVDVEGISNSLCNNLYSSVGRRITDVMLCAGVIEGGKDSCQGDSGGPLMYKDSSNVYDLVGVTSWGYGCARENFPGVYSRVTALLSFAMPLLTDIDECPRPS